jgi:hypothetical protein
MKQLKTLIISVLAITGLIGTIAVVAPEAVYAASATSTVCEAIGSGAGCSDPTAAGGGNRGSNLFTAVRLVTNILSIVVGLVAVIMIVIGGFKYITSSGDTGKTASAKGTIIYALIGLFIVGVAQLIVNLVLRESTSL